MYRQAHRKIRLWLGEDYQFSAVIRDANGIPVDLTGATAALKLEPYLGGGSTYNADLAVRSDGVVSVQLNGHEMYRQMLPGLYKYVVTIGLDDALLVGESGTVQAIAGYQGMTGVDITGLDWAPEVIEGSGSGSGNDNNEPPIADFDYEASALLVDFNSTSTDSDGTIVSTVWSFGDGATATGATASHTYSSSGTYTVTITVIDNDGASNSYSESITVAASTAPLYLVGGATGHLAWSQDAATWNVQTLGTQTLTSATYGNGLYIVGSYDAVVRRSADLVSWVTCSTGLTSSIGGIAYGNGMYVAVSNPVGIDPGQISSSPDGVTWALRATPSGCGPLTGIVFAKGIFVSCSSTGKIITSSDGITWTLYSVGSYFFQVAYSQSEDIFMAVGDRGQTYTSPNGSSWTLKSSVGGSSFSFLGLVFACDKWLAAANAGEGIRKSSDAGSTWPMSLSSGRPPVGGYGNIAIAQQSVGNISTSTDLASWSGNIPVFDGYQIEFIYVAIVPES